MLFAEEAFSLARIWISIVLLIIFAMGLSAGADDRVVPASRILEQIRAGEPVEYDGFTITGDLDLDEMDDYLPSANETSPNDALCYVVESATINIDYPLEKFNGYGTKPINAALFSLGIVLIFAAFWWHIGLGGPKDKTQERLKDKSGESQEDVEEWLDGGATDLLAFSATVFLSGTKLFIDPPPLPRIDGKSRSMIKKVFIMERVLGALFSVLFFIAIIGTIARAS